MELSVRFDEGGKIPMGYYLNNTNNNLEILIEPLLTNKIPHERNFFI